MNYVIQRNVIQVQKHQFHTLLASALYSIRNLLASLKLLSKLLEHKAQLVEETLNEKIVMAVGTCFVFSRVA